MSCQAIRCRSKGAKGKCNTCEDLNFLCLMHLGIHENNGHDIEILSKTDLESQIETQTLRKKLQKQIDVKNIILDIQINLMKEFKLLLSCIKNAADDFFKLLSYYANNFEKIGIEQLEPAKKLNYF